MMKFNIVSTEPRSTLRWNRNSVKEINHGTRDSYEEAEEFLAELRKEDSSRTYWAVIRRSE